MWNNNKFKGQILSLLLIFQLKANNEFGYYVNPCYGVTKDPNENDYLLVFSFEKWKYKIDEFINKLQNTLNNKLINENDLSVIITKPSNELLETLKIIENCISCKDEKIDGNDLDRIKNCLAELEKEEQEWKRSDIIDDLNKELFKFTINIFKKKFLSLQKFSFKNKSKISSL